MLSDERGAAAAEGPSRGGIFTLWARGPTTPSFVINTEWLACKDAALLAATCKNTINDENLKERYSEEARKAEKEKNDKEALDKIQSWLSGLYLISTVYRLLEQRTLLSNDT